MSRRRPKSTSLPAAIILWTLVLALVGWGVYQALQFRNSMRADLLRIAAAESPDSLPATDSPDPTLPPTDPLSPPDHPLPITPADTLPPRAEFQPAPLPPDAEARIPTLLESADQSLNAGRIVEARTALNTALSYFPATHPQAADLRAQLSALNKSVFFDSDVLPDDPLAKIEIIQSGDTFQKIARRNQIPSALLAAFNPSLRSNNLKLNTGIKIITGPFHLRLQKSQARADLYLRDLYITSYPITIEEGLYLPRGGYRVRSQSKIQVGSKLWIGFESAAPAAALPDGWLYASAGSRRTNSSADRPSGIKFADENLAQLYNVLVESHSLIHIDP